MGTIKGEAILPFSFLPRLAMGSTLKEKNLLPKEQILSFKISPHCGRALLHRETKLEAVKVVPLFKNEGKT